MKYVVTSYSFSQYMNDGRMTQLDCIAKAKELGFDGVEFAELIHGDDVTDVEYAAKLREEAQRVGISIENYAFGADFINGSEGDTEAEIRRVKGLIDAAQALGTPRVRHDCTQGVQQERFRSFDALLPRLVAACREVTEYARTKGIRTMVENHGFFCQDSERVEKLVNAVDSDNFGLLVDIGNFTCAGEDPRIAVGRVAPYAFHVHAKDFHIRGCEDQNPGRGYFMSRAGTWLRGSILGHGDVPVKACLAALKRVGYDGTITLEFEGLEDSMLGISIGLENLRRYWDEL